MKKLLPILIVLVLIAAIINVVRSHPQGSVRKEDHRYLMNVPEGSKDMIVLADGFRISSEVMDICQRAGGAFAMGGKQSSQGGTPYGIECYGKDGLIYALREDGNFTTNNGQVLK